MISTDARISVVISVRLWKFKDGGSKKARFLQGGDQVSRILFDFLTPALPPLCFEWGFMRTFPGNQDVAGN